MKTKRRLLSRTIIVLATQGDINTMGIILKHYEKYIIKLSQKTLYDEFGNAYVGYDEDIKRSLETELIIAVLKFRVND